MTRPAIALTVLLAACGGDGGRTIESASSLAATAASPPGTLATAESVTVERPLSLPSQLYVEHDAAVLARSTGVVESILADIGTRVSAGQPLARLESADQEIALAQAREQAANASQRVERQRALTTAGVVTRADSEQVEFEHREPPISRSGRRSATTT